MATNASNKRLQDQVRELEAQVRDLEQKLAGQTGSADQHANNIPPQTILDNIPAPVWLRDGNFRFIAVNKAYEKLCARGAKDILGKKIEDIWPPEAALIYRASDRSILKNGKANTFMESVSNSRSTRILHETTKTPIFDEQGVIIGILGIAHDITKLKNTKRQLTHLNNLLHELQTLSNTGGWEFDPASRKTYWTENHFRLYGYKPEEVRNHFLFFLKTIVHPDDLTTVRSRFRKAMNTRSKVDMTYRGIRKDGEIRHFTSVIVPEVDSAGNLTRLYGVALDITAFQQAQEAMRQAAQKAEEASRAKSEFLANMSHEIRTPLNGVLGMLQLLSHTKLDKEQATNVSVALDSGQGLLTIINDVLHLSKLEAGKLELQNRPFAIHETIHSLEQLFRFPASENRTRLSFHVEPSVPQYLSGDKERLRQVLFNLIGNAIKFTENGKITLSISALPANARPGQCRLLIILEDTGIGIAPDKIDFILKPFSQVDGSHTRKYQGSGLGLHIVRRTVELLGGGMSITSVPEQGTSIYLSLPFAKTTELPEKQHLECPLPIQFSGKNLSLLVVEDERVNLFIITRFLEKLGHASTVARSGEEALDILQTKHFDAILMDIQMPGMDGLETARRIRSDPTLKARSTTPIIALTAHAMEGDQERFLRQGMDGYLSKPISLEALRETLEKLTAEPQDH